MATAGLSAIGYGQASLAAALPAGAGRSIGTLRQVRTAALEIGYAELGPATGQPVILLHGWPYDIHSFEEAAPLLAGAGYRVLMPYLRGYGTISLKPSSTWRRSEMDYGACNRAPHRAEWTLNRSGRQ